MARKASSDDALQELRAFGLAYPGAHIKSPWPGHLDLAVKDKTFAYLPPPGEPFSIGCKLPQSCSVALMLPFTKPTEYGLGKSGWVTANPPPDRAIPVEMFKEWIDESYRAQAPKTLLKQLLTGPATTTKPAAATRKKAVAKKAVAKKAVAKKAVAKKAVAKKSAATKR